MLKHQNIVDRLSETQKIQILTDVRVLSMPEYTSLGIPEFKFSYLKRYKNDVYPSPTSMANSWNVRAVSACADEMAAAMSAENINIVTLPSAVPKLNLTDAAISEDPLLSSRMVSAYLTAIKSKGMGVVLDGAYLDEYDVSKLDKIPSSKLISEFVIRPLHDAVAMNSADGVIVGSDIDVENYEDVNSYLLKAITSGGSSAFQNTKILCKNIPQEETVSKIVHGYVCLDGSEVVLKAAVDRYRRLKQGITQGKVSVSELDAEIENGTAFPPEEIDKAVDGVIEFIFDITKNYNSKVVANPLNYGISKTIAEESIVLLKNSNKLLPMNISSKKVNNVAFVGDILMNYLGDGNVDTNEINEFFAYAKNLGIAFQGFFRGYSITDNRNEKILLELDQGLAGVSTVVLFLGLNPQRERNIDKTENLYLPANQIAVVEKLRDLGKQVIAVVSSDRAIDVTFAESVDALMLAPLNTRLGFEAVMDLTVGKFSPSGKLAYSLYSETDNAIMKQKYYLELPQTKVGTFVGYRYYDSANYDVAYPFGFGLSFSKFTYSGLSVQGNSVVFTVKNSGKIAAAEIAQVYIGMSDVSVGRPKKELVGFEKIFLQPGTSATVTIPIAHLEAFDSASNRWIVEQGEYTVYVGASLNDIRLRTKVYFGGEAIQAQQNDLYNYLQSETNIFSDKYTLEANYKLMKKNVRNIAFGIGSLVLAISMFIFSLASGTVSIFFNIVAAILAIASAIFFILEATDRKKINENERKAIDAANQAHFNDATVIPSYSTAGVFVDEFDRISKEGAVATSNFHKRPEIYLEYVNEGLTFEAASQQFIAFAASRGYKLDFETVRTLFSAMSASRLVITKGMTTDSFTVIVKLLSEYFGTDLSVDIVDSSYVNDNCALFRNFGGRKQRTSLMNTIFVANEASTKVFISALTDVKLAELSNYFVTFARYIRNPRNETTVQVVNENEAMISLTLPKNLWFFLNLNMNESLSGVPAYVSELASFVKVEYSSAAQMPLTQEIVPFSYYQFDYLLEKIKNKYGISEETWKKIDSVEAFVNASAPYAIGNRTSIALERFFAVYRACGGEEKDALDRAMSARVIPSAIVALDPIEDSEKRNLSEKLDAIFGEENVDVSRSVIRASGTAVL